MKALIGASSTCGKVTRCTARTTLIFSTLLFVTLGALLVAGYACSDEIDEPSTLVADNFTTQQSSFPHYNGDEYPGGWFWYSWTSSGYSGGALKINYNYTDGGLYSVWQYDTSSKFTGSETGFSFYAKDTKAGRAIIARVIDAGNQTHQYILNASSPNWEKYTLPLRGGKSLSYWGGANDGVIHDPVRSIQIGTTNVDNYTGELIGTLYIDEVTIYYGREIVTVDLNTNTGPVTYRSSGVLHSISASSPSTDLIAPLKTKLWRSQLDPWSPFANTGIMQTYNRVAALGMRVQAVLSDQWTPYISQYGYPGDGGNWTTWYNVVNDALTRVRNAGYTVEWDIWNEPGYSGFWPRSQSQFFELWRRTTAQVRAFNPNAVIIGPSLDHYDSDYMKAFLNYAKTNNVLPSILSWHELASGVQYDYKKTRARVEYIKAWMATNGISINRININEFIRQDFQLQPGYLAMFLTEIDKSGIDQAAHSGWMDPDGYSNNCLNMSLDGLLTPSQTRRSVWWAAKGYGDITGTLVNVDPSSSVNGIAGKDISTSTKVCRVLLGRDCGPSGNVEVQFNNVNTVFPGLSTLRVIAEHIPDSGPSELSQTTQVINALYSVSNNQVKVVLPSFGPTDAYTVVLSSDLLKGLTVGIRGSDLFKPAAIAAGKECNFVVWGRISIVSSSMIRLDDASGAPVVVIAPGYQGLSQGGYARAKGWLDTSITPHVLRCNAADVVQTN